MLSSGALLRKAKEDVAPRTLCAPKTVTLIPADGNQTAGEGEGEVAFFSAKRWDRINKADLIESATPCHDAQVVGL